MPFLDDPFEKDEEKDNLQLAQGQAGQVAPVTGGAPQTQSQSPAPAANAGQTPGRYVNFERYFNANKDAATNTGNQVASGIEKQGQSVQDELTQRQDTFGKAIQTNLGGAATAPTKVAPESPGKPRSAPVTPPRMPTTPAATAAATPPAPAQAVQWRGPGALHEGSGWDALVSKAGTAASQAGTAATSSGLQALLQQQQKGTQYTPGQSRFDAGLVGASSGDKFAALKEKFGGLPKSLGAADAASVQQSGEAQARVGAYNEKLAAAAAERSKLLESQLPPRGGPAAPPLTGTVTPGQQYALNSDSRQQYRADEDTNDWLGKVLREGHGGFLGIGGSTLIESLPPRYWELPADRLAELTADDSPFMKRAIEYYGVDKAREIANAFRDYSGRAARKKAYLDDAKRGTDAADTAAKSKNAADPNYTPTHQSELTKLLGPSFEWLASEAEKKRANGDVMPASIDFRMGG